MRVAHLKDNWLNNNSSRYIIKYNGQNWRVDATFKFWTFEFLQMHTSSVCELSPVYLVLDHICPVEQALIKVEVQGNGVSQAWEKQTVISFVQVYPSDFMSDREDDEGFKGICPRWMKQVKRQVDNRKAQFKQPHEL